MGFAGNIAAKFSLRAESIHESLSATGVEIVANPLSIVAAIIVIKLIKTINLMQNNTNQQGFTFSS